MSAEIVNLRRTRKTKLRIAAAETAATNRVLFGRTKGERALQASETARFDRALDAHRLSDAIPSSPGDVAGIPSDGD